MALTPQAALANLTQHPRTFLKANLVKVGQFGGVSRTIQGCVFQSSGGPMAHRYGTVLGSYNQKAVQDFTFSGAVNMGFASVVVDVQFIQMFAHAAGGPIPWYPMTVGAGTPDIMITTKLTGCSFLVRNNAGVIECAHIQPNAAANPPQTGQALRTTLSAGGGYASLFGRGRTGMKGYESAEAATVIGVRRNNAWNIYAQRQVAGQDTFKDVERIFPR